MCICLSSLWDHYETTRTHFSSGVLNQWLLNDSFYDYYIILSLFDHFHPFIFYGLTWKYPYTNPGTLVDGSPNLEWTFEWSVVHPPVYCVIINYCLLTHLLLSPTPIVSTYCSIVMTTYNAQERVSFFLWNFLRSNNFLSIFRYLTKHTNSRFWKFTERKKLSHTKGYWA